MIEKLKNIPIDMNGKPSAVWLKINELVDAVNALVYEHDKDSDWYDGQTRAENVLTMVDKQVTANLPNIDAGELAFLSKENSDLKDELEHTRKALEIAVDALKWIHETYNLGMGYEAAIMEKCEFALEQITALEQKDVK